MRCATYARMSRDEAEDGLGIERQTEAIEKFCAERGWEIDPRWRLTETASASVKKPRPVFRRLMKGIERGEVTHLVVYAADRLTRRLHDTAALLDAVEATGCEVHFVVGGDLGNGYSRGMAGVLAGVAAMETQVMSERHRQRVRQNRRQGRVTNGGRRGFGYETDRQTPVPEEFALLREAFERLRNGEGLSAIAKSWNRRGVQTATHRGSDGQPKESRSTWRTKTIRDTLSRPALAGRVVEWQRERQPDGTMVRRQVPVLDDDGQPVRGQWPAVFSDSEFDELQVLLAARRRMPEGWSSTTKHLLTGLLVCGRCGGRMVAHRQTSGITAYTCRDYRHLSRDERILDEHVTSVVQQWITDAGFPVEQWVDPESAGLARALGDLEQRRESTIRAMVTGNMQPETFAATVAAFDSEISALRSQQVDDVIQRFEQVYFGSSLDLSAMPFKERRAFISMCVDRVLVRPTGRRGKGFDPDAVTVDLHEELVVERAWTDGGEVQMVLRRRRPDR